MMMMMIMMMIMMWLEYKTLSFGVGDTALLLSLRRAAYVSASCSMFMYEILISYRVEFSCGLVSETICKSRIFGYKFYGKSTVKRTKTDSVMSIGMPLEGCIVLVCF
jgi:hypothetical protein